jgi:3D (Asp-Asp-Asp) domain-containing protein
VRIIPVLALIFLLTGCARELPRYEKPLKRSSVQYVRTTAYTHTERDHRRYGRKTALGTTLRRGKINSAAADWARWPAGTVFRIRENGEIYEVDDYGWALAGRNTIDLYKPTRRAMNAWGVRRVHIEILEWGDPWESYRRLKPAKRYRHVKRMMKEIREFY